MVYEISHTQNAREQTDHFIRKIKMAQSASQADEMRDLLTEAFPFGENALINMEAMLDAANDLIISDIIEEAMDHMGRSIESIKSIDEVSDNDLSFTISRISQHADMSAGYLNDAIQKMG